MAPEFRLARLTDPLPAAAEELAEAACREGHRHIRRLVGEWLSGVNRFDGLGEILLGAYCDTSLVGIGGLTHEPSRADWLRMRRFYVLPLYRGKGVGRMLALHLVDRAQAFTTTVVVHAGNQGGAGFWQAVGFRSVAQAGYTHVLHLE